MSLQITVYSRLICRPRLTLLIRRRCRPGSPPKPITLLCGVGNGWRNPGRHWPPATPAFPTVSLSPTVSVVSRGPSRADRLHWRSRCHYKRSWRSSDLCRWSCRSAAPHWNPAMPLSTKLLTPFSNRHVVSARFYAAFLIIICPIAIAYSMGQIIKSVCVCQCVCLRALSRSHFLIDFHSNWHRCKNPQKKKRVC